MLGRYRNCTQKGDQARESFPDLLPIVLTVAIVCFVVYLRALSCDFVNWEDQDYVLNNQSIRYLDMDFLIWAFTSTPVNSFWLPLTYISFAIDYYFWGLKPLGFHLTNILLHAINTGLVVLIADALFRKILSDHERLLQNKKLYSTLLILAGLLFGIHPTKVEAVVWVTERRAVLNGMFSLSSIYFYLRYVDCIEKSQAKAVLYCNYVLSLSLFLLSLMAKPTSIPMAGMLLVLDWYPLKRLLKDNWKRVTFEKLPYFLFAVIVISYTILLHSKADGFNPLREFPLSIRAIAAGNAVFDYLRIMLFPIGILPYYDLPKQIPPIFILKAISVCFFLSGIIYWRYRMPLLAVSVISFVIPIIPTLHFFAGGAQVIITPRYTYLPSLLISVAAAAMVAIGYEKVALRWKRWMKLALTLVFSLLISFYVVETQRLIADWKNSGAMWSKVIKKRSFDKAYFYRALYYVDSGDYAAAVADYSTCLQIAQRDSSPDSFNFYAFRAEALIKSGLYSDALADIDLAIARFPHRLYFYHRGLALQGLGMQSEAVESFRRAGNATGQMYWFPPETSPD